MLRNNKSEDIPEKCEGKLAEPKNIVFNKYPIKIIASKLI